MEVNQLIDRVNSFCTPRMRLQLDDAQNEVLGAFADRACIQTLNDELVAEQRNARMNREEGIRRGPGSLFGGDAEAKGCYGSPGTLEKPQRRRHGRRIAGSAPSRR
jgi:hypothetical protein